MSLTKLAIRIGFIGGAGVVIAINTVPYIISQRLKKIEPYVEALELTRKHPEAIKYMGEPIVDHRINVTIKKNYNIDDDDNSWFRIPVSGPKSKGSVACYYSSKTNLLTEAYVLKSAELYLDNFPNHKLVLKKESD